MGRFAFEAHSRPGVGTPVDLEVDYNIESDVNDAVMSRL